MIVDAPSNSGAEGGVGRESVPSPAVEEIEIDAKNERAARATVFSLWEREAAAKCRSCNRHYCRECVTFMGGKIALRGLLGGGAQGADRAQTALWIVDRSGLRRFGIFSGLGAGCLCEQVDDFDSESISRRFDMGGDGRVKAQGWKNRAGASLARLFALFFDGHDGQSLHRSAFSACGLMSAADEPGSARLSRKSWSGLSSPGGRRMRRQARRAASLFVRWVRKSLR